MLVVDEIDASLHPRLTASLIELIHDQDTNPNGAQLVFTTHDASLLSPVLGGDVLQRDEVWFVTKRRDGSTELYPLSDFHPRKGENTERRYLGGSYGAVPSVLGEDLVDAVRAAGLVRGPMARRDNLFLPAYGKAKLDIAHLDCGIEGAIVRAERVEPTGVGHTINPSTGVWKLVRGLLG
jgi:hypothetical protein